MTGLDRSIVHAVVRTGSDLTAAWYQDGASGPSVEVRKEAGTRPEASLRLAAHHAEELAYAILAAVEDAYRHCGGRP